MRTPYAVAPNVTLRAKNYRGILQRIVSTLNGDYIPLLYPILMISPSIGYKMTPSCGSTAGVLPSCIMADNNSTHGFSPVTNRISQF